MEKFNGFEEFLELLQSENSSPMLSAIKLIMNTVMLLERHKAIGTEPYQRSSERVGFSSGFKGKTINTRMGPLELKVPQTRGVEFYPPILEKALRSERALMAALAEMYVQGTSTRFSNHGKTEE